MANHAGIYVVDGERQRKDDGKGWIKARPHTLSAPRNTFILHCSRA